MHDTVHHSDRREAYQLPTDLGDKLAEGFSHLRMSFKVEEDPYHTPYSYALPQTSFPRADQYGQRTQQRLFSAPCEPRYGYTE